MARFFGGGSFILRGLESKEAFGRLESEFLIYAEEAIENLVGSDGR